MNLYTENNKIEIDILHNLKEIIDPEVTINIVDLGLIYKVHYNNEINKIHIVMTLSTKGCPMGDLIKSQIKECINRYYPTSELELELVWDPEWTRDFITPNGKKQLGLY